MKIGSVRPTFAAVMLIGRFDFLSAALNALFFGLLIIAIDSLGPDPARALP